MRKLVVLFAIALAVAFATSAYAEVQNVKVGGDIRIRPLYQNDITTLNSSDDDDDYGFIEQRTRVIVEADLTDNVAVAATIEAESQWGLPENVFSAIPGIDVRKEWEAGFSEAWVQLSELYYSPLTVKIGRQYLHYGTGFVISSKEYENNFDAVRAILNFDPWTIDIVYSKLIETDGYSPLAAAIGLTADDILNANNDIDLWGGNVRYTADTWTVEGYVWGQRDRGYEIWSFEEVSSESVDPMTGFEFTDISMQDVLVSKPNLKPIIFGIRGDITPIENLDLWGEVAYETGDIGDQDLGAFGADVGATYTFADVAWRPTLGAGWTFGQGDDTDADFYEFYEYNYYGYAYSPEVSNIHILNANLMVEPVEKLALILDYYHYIQDEEKVQVMGDPTQDNGGVMAATNGTDKTLGNELDLIAEYDYTEDVSTQLYLAWFWPGDAYDSPADDDAYEIRGEIIVSF